MNGFSGPKSSRAFRETGPRTGIKQTFASLRVIFKSFQNYISNNTLYTLFQNGGQ